MVDSRGVLTLPLLDHPLDTSAASHVEHPVAGILDHSLNLPWPKLWVILRYFVALKDRHHVIMGCLPNLFGNTCHALSVLFKVGDQMSAHSMHFPSDGKLLLQDHLGMSKFSYRLSLRILGGGS